VNQQQQQHQLAMATSPITAGLDLSFLAGLNPELYQSLGQSLAFLNQGKFAGHISTELVLSVR
jgi:hypothetical protein